MRQDVDHSAPSIEAANRGDERLTPLHLTSQCRQGSLCQCSVALLSGDHTQIGEEQRDPWQTIIKTHPQGNERPVVFMSERQADPAGTMLPTQRECLQSVTNCLGSCEQLL